jgi:hypothetical protein
MLYFYSLSLPFLTFLSSTTLATPTLIPLCVPRLLAPIPYPPLFSSFDHRLLLPLALSFLYYFILYYYYLIVFNLYAF